MLESAWKLFLAGAGRGLQTRRAVLDVSQVGSTPTSFRQFKPLFFINLGPVFPFFGPFDAHDRMPITPPSARAPALGRESSGRHAASTHPDAPRNPGPPSEQPSNHAGTTDI